MNVLSGVVGAVLVLTIVSDLLVTVALPRAARRGRLSRYVWRGGWTAVRAVADRVRSASLRESMLGAYGPLSVFLVLAVWIVLLIFGYGLIVYALRDQISPRPADLPSALYLGGTALLTLSYANDAGTGLAAKVVGLLAASTGLVMIALVITFLFSLYAAFREREIEVITLEARAGAPPSGVAFLEFHAQYHLEHEIAPAFDRWQRWAAAVLDSHLAYPILAYFRSSHDHDSWISSLGAIMDAATLVLTTIEGGPVGAAKMALWVGGHCIDDLADYFGFRRSGDAGIDLADFRNARERLERAGYRLQPEAEAWEKFQRLRSEHAGSLNALAAYWATPPSEWIGETSTHFQHPGERPARARSRSSAPR
ncbi:MAG TPA: hypothetical protein VF134_04490 [Candidatus Dormibacteraeota bacterium]